MPKNKVSKVENKRLDDIDHTINKVLSMMWRGTHVSVHVRIPKHRNVGQKGPWYFAVFYEPLDYAFISLKAIDAIREDLSKIGVTIVTIAASDVKDYPKINKIHAKSVLELSMMDTVDDTRTRAAPEEERAGQ